MVLLNVLVDPKPTLTSNVEVLFGIALVPRRDTKNISFSIRQSPATPNAFKLSSSWRHIRRQISHIMQIPIHVGLHGVSETSRYRQLPRNWRSSSPRAARTIHDGQHTCTFTLESLRLKVWSSQTRVKLLKMLFKNKGEVELFIDSDGVLREGRVVKRLSDKEIRKLHENLSGEDGKKEGKGFTSSIFSGLKNTFFSKLGITSGNDVDSQPPQRPQKHVSFKLFSKNKPRIEEETLKECIRPRRKSWRSKLYRDAPEDEQDVASPLAFDGAAHRTKYPTAPDNVKAPASGSSSGTSDVISLTKSNSIVRSDKNAAKPKTKKSNRSRRKSFSDGYISIDEEEKEALKNVGQLPSLENKADFIKEWSKTALKTSSNYSLPSPSSGAVEDIIHKSIINKKNLKPVKVRAEMESYYPKNCGYVPKQQKVYTKAQERKTRSHRKSISDGELSPSELRNYQMPRFQDYLSNSSGKQSYHSRTRSVQSTGKKK